jgi:hypothetical protein
MDKEQSKQTNSGLATASLVLGILATVLGVIGVGVVLGILAIIFGAISVKNNKGKSLAGIITGAVGIILFILMIVFTVVIGPIAIKSLQASQRDTERKNDVSVLVSDITTYMSDNRGQLPDNQWVSDMTYKLALIKSTQAGNDATTDTATYTDGVDCDGRTGTHSFSVTVLLESGTTYCQGS